MTAVWQIVLALGSVAALVCLMGVVRHFAGVWQINAEVQRKLVHIGTGLYALSLPWLFPDRWPVYLLVGVTLVVMLILRLPNSRLGATLHGVERQSYGDFLLAISVGVCLFLAADLGQMYLYVLPIAVLTLADAAAALTGSAYGTKFFKVEEGEKSIEGSAMFFLLTLIIAMMVLMLMTPFAPLNIILLSLMVAGFGALVEAASWRGFDNLFLPIGILIFLAVHGQSSVAELVALSALFVLSIFGFRVLAPRFGLTKHAAQVYVTAVFLLLSVTEVQNTLFPILVLIAHAWSRSTNPCSSKFPDLDIVAGLALVSFGSLIVGTAMGPTAVSFYGVVAMGMVMGLCAVGAGRWPLMPRLLLVCAVAAISLGLRAVVVAVNAETVNWHGPMWTAVIACLVLTGGPPLAVSAFFNKRRVLKLTILALLIPLPFYLIAASTAGASL